MRLQVDARSPIPIRRQLTEQLKHVIEGGNVKRDDALPSIRELAGFLGINPNTVARVIEDLKQSGYVEARRGKGVFVTADPPARPSPTLRERFLRDAVIRAAALGMTADDLAVGVLSLAGVRPAAVRGGVEILLVECSLPELDFFARELEAHIPVHVDKVLLGDLATAVRSRKGVEGWRAAVTSFFHLPEVERRLAGLRVPVIALLAEVHLETLHRLAQFPSGTRVGVASSHAETAHNLEHSIANAGLPNITLLGACPAEGAGLERLVRRVDVMVCSTAAGDRVRQLAGSAVRVLIDDRALDPRAIQMLATLLVQRDGDRLDNPPASHPRAAESPGRSGRPVRSATGKSLARPSQESRPRGTRPSTTLHRSR
jgi:GntR family transcriptional regulator